MRTIVEIFETLVDVDTPSTVLIDFITVGTQTLVTTFGVNAIVGTIVSTLRALVYVPAIEFRHQLVTHRASAEITSKDVRTIVRTTITLIRLALVEINATLTIVPNEKTTLTNALVTSVIVYALVFASVIEQGLVALVDVRAIVLVVLAQY